MNSTEQPKSQPLFRQQSPVIGIPATPSHYLPQNYVQQPTGEKAPWSTGLFECFADVPNCCITCFCPCITFGKIVETVDQGSTSCEVSGAIYTLLGVTTGLACLYSYLYRSRMRNQYTLETGPCPDCCVHFLCETCALCQEYRELKNQGFDMSLGGHGNNMERQPSSGMPTGPPPVEHGMRR